MSEWTDFCQKRWVWRFDEARIDYLVGLKNRTWDKDVEIEMLKKIYRNEEPIRVLEAVQNRTVYQEEELRQLKRLFEKYKK